jgi:hypothetical protein
MADVLRPLGVALTRLPVGPEHEGRTVGFAFEMYYRMGNLVPWREPAWALLHERTSLLAEMCNEVAQLGGAPEVVAGAGERAAAIAATLEAGVPAELRPRSR